VPRRALVGPPAAVRLPQELRAGELPQLDELTRAATSPRLPAGGEAAALARLGSFEPGGYADAHDDLAADGTSRLSPYLHFGCLSPLTVAAHCGERSPELVRQLCWRDFHHHTPDAFPGLARTDLRGRGRRWRTDPEELRAWEEGMTGFPIVDAAMRQLLAEGWMHNRARLIVGSFLTKHLGHHWREGYAHFARWLVDADVANNAGNWQWVAGTGTDTRPSRILNPIRQAQRFDPNGDYVRRYLPELAHLDARSIHTPWRLPAAERTQIDYPARVVDHEAAALAFRNATPRRASG
jgi:deoxyribodipyrimidine photo-lyase